MGVPTVPRGILCGAGRCTVMPQRLAFFNCTQKPVEFVTDFETRIRRTARKTKYADMTNPLQELMRDRLCTGVHNKDLRELLFHHYEEDGKTPFTFEEPTCPSKILGGSTQHQHYHHALCYFSSRRTGQSID